MRKNRDQAGRHAAGPGHKDTIFDIDRGARDDTIITRETSRDDFRRKGDDSSGRNGNRNKPNGRKGANTPSVELSRSRPKPETLHHRARFDELRAYLISQGFGEELDRAAAGFVAAIASWAEQSSPSEQPIEPVELHRVCSEVQANIRNTWWLERQGISTTKYEQMIELIALSDNRGLPIEGFAALFAGAADPINYAAHNVGMLNKEHFIPNGYYFWRGSTYHLHRYPFHLTR